MRMDADGIYTYIYARTRMHASTFTFRHPLHIKLWFVFVLWCKMCKDTLLFLLVHKIKRGFCLTYFCLPAHRLLSFFSHPCVCVCVFLSTCKIVMHVGRLSISNEKCYRTSHWNVTTKWCRNTDSSSSQITTIHSMFADGFFVCVKEYEEKLIKWKLAIQCEACGNNG